jgi:hypothetical protein
MKEMVNKINLLSYNKKNVVQKTWNDEDETKLTFQEDLEIDDE